jgi:hypothetical protein
VDRQRLSLPRPDGWCHRVNQPQTAAEAAAYHEHLQHNRLYGTPAWTAATARALRLEANLHPPGRPRGWLQLQKRQEDTDNGSRHLQFVHLQFVQVPYLVWVSIATVLQLAISARNG